jgi:hypothetical protein
VLSSNLRSLQCKSPQLGRAAANVLAAIPFVVGAVACIALAALYAAKFKGAGLGERNMTAKAA